MNDGKLTNVKQSLEESLKNQHCGFIDGIGNVYAVSEETIKDALELLKPRVLTIEEAFGAEDPIYFESFDGKANFWTDIYLSEDLTHAVLNRFGSTSTRAFC